MGKTDEMIIERVLDGDKNAYAFLVDRYKDKVYSLVFGIVRSKESAGELAQDVFVKAYKGLKKFRKDSSFSTWIYRIAYNTAISETRRKKRLFLSFDEQLEQVGSFNIDGSFESDNELETKQIQLRKAINALDAEERLIIMMYYFEEQSIEEISKTSGLSKSNVKIRLFRLRKKLKETITRLNKVETVVY